MSLDDVRPVLGEGSRLVTTPAAVVPLIAPGAQVVVRDEVWLVRTVDQTRTDGRMVKATGVSELVAGQEATFFTNLDDVQPLRPEATRFVEDGTPGFRRSRLYLEALLRKTPFPATETRLAVGHRQLLDDLEYQWRPAQAALEALRPRLLVADAVGLGKTLEVGVILSELIRRGRGDRILVVTPRHILEQFQHELWTRFAIPLVRLDSEGIQRVRQKIPATRNPFTFYKRAIISIDTLKNAGRYRQHLEGIRWDAVVIDECHNLVNRGTWNNQLARVLAPRTEALILTSATPHNGKPESFAELVRLLDPTAVADPRSYDRREIEHLYIRRHKNSPEVAAVVGANWADRLPPRAVPVAAGAAEEAVFRELAEVWLHPDGRAPVTGKGARLFPYTLLKAFLSSHRALAETIANRRKTLAGSGRGGAVDNQAEDFAAVVRLSIGRRAGGRVDQEEHAAAVPPTDGTAADGTTGGRQVADRDVEERSLARLAELTARIGDGTGPDGSAKLVALVDSLREIGVGRGATTRAVVFSERHATLTWLRDVLPGLLGLPDAAVRILHGGLSDAEQMTVVEQFALADSQVRILVTGDIAAEGVNLHRQCHHLVHYDLPWSLITIEQRNGRIDRYGQRHAPDIRALLLTTDGHGPEGKLQGDLDVLAKLLDKEHEAHRALGDAGALMGLRSAAEEAEEITRMLADQRPLDEVVPDTAAGFDLMLAIEQGGTDTVHTLEPMSLFDSDMDFVEEALHESYEDPDQALDIRRQPEDGLLTLNPPADLRRRLEVLPQSYLAEQQVRDRLRLTADPQVAEEMLRRAREQEHSTSIWPSVLHLSSQHPLVEWLTDKVLAAFDRDEAPVLTADVPEPTFLVQGMYSNHRGQPTVVEWMAIDRLSYVPNVRPMDAVLREAGVGPRLSNSGQLPDGILRRVKELAPAVVGAAGDHMRKVLDQRGKVLEDRVAAYRERLAGWHGTALQLAMDVESKPLRLHREREVEAVTSDTEALIASLSTTGDPYIRIAAVLVGAGHGR